MENYQDFTDDESDQDSCSETSKEFTRRSFRPSISVIEGSCDESNIINNSDIVDSSITEEQNLDKGLDQTNIKEQTFDESIIVKMKSRARIIESDSEFEEDDDEDSIKNSSSNNGSDSNYKEELSSKSDLDSTKETESNANSSHDLDIHEDETHISEKDRDKGMKSLYTAEETTQEFEKASDDEEEIFNKKNIRPSLSSTRIEYREVHSIISSSSESASGIVEIIDDSEKETELESIIRPPTTKLRQPTMQEMFIKANNTSSNISNVSSNVSIDKSEVSREEYQMQKEKIGRINTDLRRVENLLNTIKLSALPDKGEQLILSHKRTVEALALEEEKLKKMSVANSSGNLSKGSGSPIITLSKPATWQELKNTASSVQPRTFGAKALATHDQQKTVTMDRLHQLHSSLKNCPTEETMAEDPKGLKVDLMNHQRHALAWLMWRERQKPSGGILADDMGLGKTLTMISLMMKTNEEKENEDKSDSEEDDGDEKKHKRYKYYGGTLIVCPASLLSQWDGEVKRRVQRGLVSLELYHGAKRETKSKRLANYDMVVTTYSIVMNEMEKDTPLFKIKWERIVLDEAHQIRNHKARTSIAVCELSAKARWALTGTPIHNKEVDLYSLLKFLRCSPFDDLTIFKRWVSDKAAGGQERLNTVMSSLMLRRTKAQLQQKGSLQCLPERNWEIIEIKLEKEEMDIYQKILIFSKTLFSQYLHQRAEKNTDAMMNPLDTRPSFVSAPADPNGEYYKMHKKLVKMNKMKDVKQHEILVLLLRLRQVCCHPHLITAMLDDGTLETSGAAEEEEDDTDLDALNLLDQLNKLNLDDEDNDDYNQPQESVGLAEATRGILKLSNPIFNSKRRSTKVEAVINLLKEKVVETTDKCIIVSQWTSFLKLIAIHLEEERIFFDQLDGTVPVFKRAAIVDNFNNPNNKVKVLLLSLTAGGVGLNLVGANHLLLLDLHWNPQLEMQAQDRIYRVGQKKPVYVYKFMSMETIEERIKALQDHKKNIAQSVLTGAKMQQSKLSLDDLKMLFDM